MLMLLWGCQSVEPELVPTEVAAASSSDKYSVHFAESGTKLYIEDGDLHWTESDRLSIFRSSVNERFVFDGATGDREGTFSKDPGDGSVQGSAYDVSYAIYPYAADTECTEEGKVTCVFPAIQSYSEDSFGQGANIMVASSVESIEGKVLHFRNICGFVKIQIYGDPACVLKSITLKGNNGEKIAGRGTVEINGLTTEMDESATEEITLDCGEGVALAEEPKSFWIAVPPVTFENGFTITVTTVSGKSKTKSTSKNIAVKRNIVVPMAGITFNTYGPVEERTFLLFGDSITPQGVRTELQRLLDLYPGADVAEDGFTITRFKWKVVEAGVSGEVPLQISARQGGVPIFLKGPFTIPAAAGSVVSSVGSLLTTWSGTATVSETPTTSLKFNFGGESTSSTYTGCSNPFLVNGVECTYSYNSESGEGTLTRVSSGNEVTCSEDYVRVYPYAAWKYRDCYAFSTYQGTNGSYNKTPAQGGNTYEVLAKFYDAETEYSQNRRHIVIGYHNARWTAATTAYFEEYYRTHDGEYMDMLKMGTTRAEEIAGLLGVPLTEQDKSEASQGIYPSSWIAQDQIHMTSLGYRSYAACVFLKMKEVGYLGGITNNQNN